MTSTTTPTTWMLLLWGDPDACVDVAAAYDTHEAFAAACAANGHEIVGGEELASPSRARLLHVGADGPQVTDGPFAETTEQLGGFYLVRTSDPDGLLQLAAPLVMDEVGTIELRPVTAHEEAPAAVAEPVAETVA